MYERKSRLSRKQQTKLIELFVAGSTARAAAEMADVSRQTARIYFQRLRKLIAQKTQASFEISGEVEADESYFGGVRKGKRGRGAAGKIPVFGLLKRGGKVYTAIIPDAKAKTLLPIIYEKVKPDSIVYTDCLPSYNALDVSHFHHQRVNHCEVFVAGKTNHINGIENFWNQAKRHLRRFNCIPKESFFYFLKECEWRFNSGTHKKLLNQLLSWALRKF